MSLMSALWEPAAETPLTTVDIDGTPLTVSGITEQLRLGYDAGNYVSFTVSSTGNLAITPVGGTLNIGALNATSILTQAQVLSSIQFGAL